MGRAKLDAGQRRVVQELVDISGALSLVSIPDDGIAPVEHWVNARKHYFRVQLRSSLCLIMVGGKP